MRHREETIKQKKPSPAEPPVELADETLSGIKGGRQVPTVEIETLEAAPRRRAYQHNQTDLDFH